MQKARKQLFSILLIFAFPVIISWFMYYYHANFNFKTMNHGVLLKAPIDVKDLYFTLQGGKERKWRVIYITQHICNKDCKKMVYQLQQVKKALGQDSDRVSNLVLDEKNSQLVKIPNGFAQQGIPQFMVRNKIFLVDPIGNLFMYYPDSVDPMNILKDLKRVLEVSQIG